MIKHLRFIRVKIHEHTKFLKKLYAKFFGRFTILETYRSDVSIAYSILFWQKRRV